MKASRQACKIGHVEDGVARTKIVIDAKSGTHCCTFTQGVAPSRCTCCCVSILDPVGTSLTYGMIQAHNLT